MLDEQQSIAVERELAAKIVAAFVRREQIEAAQLATLIARYIRRTPASVNRG